MQTVQDPGASPKSAITCAAQPSARFLDALKRLNAKERNFLMRYALCGRAAPALSQDFVNDLRQHLKQIGMAEADDAQAVYFGMDYHLEWIHAALLYAQDSEPKRYRITQQNARIEDVDLLVVLRRADGHLLLVLIEAKGVTPFSTSQFNSKLARLKHLREAMQSPSAWITPVMLLMSPKVSRPAEKTRETFATGLHGLGFWPDPTRHQLLWMELKGFFGDIEDEGKAWSVRTCYEDGGTATSLAERDARRYDHWRIAERFSVKNAKNNGGHNAA